MDNPTVMLTLHMDTLELDIDAPELSLDVVISLIERAKRMLENQEKIVVAHQISAGVRAMDENAQRTHQVMSKIKM
jgi:hypothetical protein